MKGESKGKQSHGILVIEEQEKKLKCKIKEQNTISFLIFNNCPVLK